MEFASSPQKLAFLIMTWLVSFFEWLLTTCKKAVAFAVSVPGMILAFLGSLVAVVFDFLLDLPFFDSLISVLETVVQFGNDLFSSSFLSSNVGKTLLYTVNAQQLFLSSSTALTATFGAVSYMTIALIGVILPLVISVFVVRAILKGISIASGGILSP